MLYCVLLSFGMALDPDLYHANSNVNSVSVRLHSQINSRIVISAGKGLKAVPHASLLSCSCAHAPTQSNGPSGTQACTSKVELCTAVECGVMGLRALEKTTPVLTPLP